MKLLCVGDIHLGRQPSRIPEDVLAQLGGITPGPAAAWRRAVDYALAHDVDAVLLAGDVVEQEDDFYEAYRDLQQGVQRLAGAGIAVLGVAGNHDVAVLPRLADSVDGFRLLGRDGRWEAVTIGNTQGVQVRILGWSFPEPVVRTSPLAGGLPDGVTDDGALPTLGLLHCDRDQSGSHHAPVRSSELDAAAVDAWLLGHIHKPDPLVAPRPNGYLGSLTGLDPGEAGARGPWLLEVAADGSLAIDQVVLAPLRWETLVIDCTAFDDPADVHQAVIEAVRGLHDRLDTAQRPEAVGCRLRFTGRTGHRAALERILTNDDPRATPIPQDGIIYFIHDWRLETLPAIDLETLAQGSDPVALLARRLLILRGGDKDARQRLIDDARRRMSMVASDSHYLALDTDPPDEKQTAVILEAAALQALDALLAQQETTG
jgi:DNA repair protein SbcD/Mre11